MINAYICKLSPSFKDLKALHMLHGLMSEQEHCLYYRDSVSERMNIFYMFPYESIVIGALTVEIIFSVCYQTNSYMLHML